MNSLRVNQVALPIDRASSHRFGCGTGFAFIGVIRGSTLEASADSEYASDEQKAQQGARAKPMSVTPPANHS